MSIFLTILVSLITFLGLVVAISQLRGGEDEYFVLPSGTIMSSDPWKDDPIMEDTLNPWLYQPWGEQPHWLFWSESLDRFVCVCGAGAGE